MSTAKVHRRSCLRGLIGTGVGTTVGTGWLTPAWSAPQARPGPLLLCVDLPEAAALTAPLWPDATPQWLTRLQLAHIEGWHALAHQLQAQSVIAVLDERTALLWDALLTPSAQHTTHQLLHAPAASPLHLLRQRF